MSGRLLADLGTPLKELQGQSSDVAPADAKKAIPNGDEKLHLINELRAIGMGEGLTDEQIKRRLKIAEQKQIDALKAEKHPNPLDAKDSQGRTALHWAAHFKRKASLEYMFEGASWHDRLITKPDTEAADKMGLTPLMLAIDYQDTWEVGEDDGLNRSRRESVAYLLNKGANTRLTQVFSRAAKAKNLVFINSIPLYNDDNEFYKRLPHSVLYEAVKFPHTPINFIKQILQRSWHEAGDTQIIASLMLARRKPGEFHEIASLCGVSYVYDAQPQPRHPFTYWTEQRWSMFFLELQAAKPNFEELACYFDGQELQSHLERAASYRVDRSSLMENYHSTGLLRDDLIDVLAFLKNQLKLDLAQYIAKVKEELKRFQGQQWSLIEMLNTDRRIYKIPTEKFSRAVVLGPPATQKKAAKFVAQYYPQFIEQSDIRYAVRVRDIDLLKILIVGCRDKKIVQEGDIHYAVRVGDIDLLKTLIAAYHDNKSLVLNYDAIECGEKDRVSLYLIAYRGIVENSAHKQTYLNAMQLDDRAHLMAIFNNLTAAADAKHTMSVAADSKPQALASASTATSPSVVPVLVDRNGEQNAANGRFLLKLKSLIENWSGTQPILTQVLYFISDNAPRRPWCDNSNAIRNAVNTDDIEAFKRSLALHSNNKTHLGDDIYAAAKCCKCDRIRRYALAHFATVTGNSDLPLFLANLEAEDRAHLEAIFTPIKQVAASSAPADSKSSVVSVTTNSLFKENAGVAVAPVTGVGADKRFLLDFSSLTREWSGTSGMLAQAMRFLSKNEIRDQPQPAPVVQHNITSLTLTA